MELEVTPSILLASCKAKEVVKEARGLKFVGAEVELEVTPFN